MPTIRIPLHSRKHPNLFATIDEEDYPLVSEYRWYAQPGRNTFYAITFVRLRGMKKPVQLKMHRVIMDPPADLVIDHINEDGLDNRRINLRAVTHAENLSPTASGRSVSAPKIQRGNSPYYGVHFQRSRNKFTAHYKGKYLGIFTTEVEAAEAYDRVRYEDTGDHRRLNFPERITWDVESVEALSRDGFDK